ncbi:MAG: hypothetical protein LBE18_03885 [Planctomycetaceae bacterium]|jgi:hypothetical protein|nr:hypothetical protein [Planctomycetaceae bacterium]
MKKILRILKPMKYYYRQLLYSVIIFLSLSFNFFVLGGEDENVEKIFNRFVERAKLFADIFENGEPDDLNQMFTPYNHVPIINITVSKDGPDGISDYNFYVSYVNANLYFSWADYSIVRYYRNVKQSDAPEHVMVRFIDFGRIIGGNGNTGCEVHFNRKEIPTESVLVYNLFHEIGAELISSRVKWDENGNVIQKKEWNLVTKNKVLVPTIPHLLQEKLAKKKDNNQTKTFFSFKPITSPNINDKKINAVFKRIEYLANMKRPRDLMQLYNWELTQKESRGEIQCIDGKVRDIHFDTGKAGYNLSIDENGSILTYAEGIMGQGERRELENFYNNKDKSRQFYWQSHDTFDILKKGVEIKFHPNGYPAIYRTVVQDRLYGRQIEWNDEGKIISDVDLDIPKQWEGAPKQSEDALKRNQITIQKK